MAVRTLNAGHGVADQVGRSTAQLVALGNRWGPVAASSKAAGFDVLSLSL